jgi:hypothetical protein
MNDQIETNINFLALALWDPLTKRRDPSKNWCMLLVVASTRYSLVKGERIVRFVLTTQLHALEWLARAQFQEHPAEMANRAQRYGTKRTASHLVGRDYKLTFGLVGRIIN